VASRDARLTRRPSRISAKCVARALSRKDTSSGSGDGALPGPPPSLGDGTETEGIVADAIGAPRDASAVPPPRA
jgi:hypothetical protein